MEYSGMSRIITISSWPSSKTTWRTSEGSSRSPLVISSYIRATRTGVSRMPGRPRSSPMPSSSRRTPRSTFSKSKLFGSSIPPQTASAPCYVHGGDAGLALTPAAVGVGVARAGGHDAPRRTLHHRRQDLGQLLLGDGLLLHQDLDHLVGDVPVAGQHLLGLDVRLVDQAAHLLVDLERDLLRVVLLVAEVT